MRSPWTALHVFLASALSASLLLIWTQRPSLAAERETGATPAGPSHVELHESLFASGEPLRSGFEIRFPVAVGPESGAGELRESGPVVLEPAAPLRARWTSPQSLAFTPTDALAPATEYRVLLAAPLRARLAPGALPAEGLRFRTPELRVENVLLERGGGDELRIRLACDFPITAERLRKHVELRDAESAQTLDFVFAAAPEPAARKQHLLVVSGEPTPAAIDVQVEPGLVPEGGRIPSTSRFERRLTVHAPLSVTRHRCESEHLDLHFDRSSEIPRDGCWRFEPAIATQVTKQWFGLRFHADFEPGRSYALVLDEGFPGHGDARTRRVLRVPFLVPDRPAHATILAEGRHFSTRAEPRLTIRTCNLETVSLRIRRAYPNNAVFAASDLVASPHSFLDRRLFEPETRHEILVRGEKNEDRDTEVDLTELLGEAPRGLYVVDLVSAVDHWGPRDREVLQFSDLGVQLRTGASRAFARVAHIASGAARPGVRVRLYTESNQLLAEARTGAEGSAQLRWDPARSDAKPYLVEAWDGKDRSFVDMRRGATHLADRSLGGRPFLQNGELEAWCQSDRGVARPGEDVHVTAILRDRAGRVPVDRAVELRFVRPGRVVARSKTVRTPATGLLTATLPGDHAGRSGRWLFEVLDVERQRAVGRCSFQIEPFVPERIRAEARFAEAPQVGGQARCELEAAWLTGGAAAGLRFRARVRFDAHRIEVPGFDAFRFDGDPKAAPPGAIPELEGRLDENGKALLRFQVPADIGDRAAVAVSVHVRVEQSSGRPVHVFAKAVASRTELLGMRARRVDGGVDVELVHCTPDGQLLEQPRDVELRLERRDWSCRADRGGDGRIVWRYERQSHVRSTRGVRIEGGRHRVRLEDTAPTDASWECVCLEAEGQRVEANPGSALARPNRLQIDVRPIEQGEAGPAPHTHRVSVQSPIAGTAWLTVETTEPLASHVFEVARGENVFDLRIPTEIAAPNVHVVVSVTAPQQDPDAPGHFAAGPRFFTGAEPVPIPQPNRRGTLALTAPPELRPGSTLSVELEARGLSRATLAVVDEGVLRVTRHPIPDPLAWFGAPRRMATRGCDTGSALRTGLRYPKDIRTGGDATREFLSSPGARSAIRSLALFVQDVRFDDAGRARAELALPEFEGTLRIVAIAAGPEKIAVAHAQTRVFAPISMEFASPRLLAPGDETNCRLALRNLCGESGRLHVAITAPSGLSLGSPETPVSGKLLESEQGVDLDVRLRAEGSHGRHELVLRATMETESGNLHERELRVPVVVRRPSVRDHVHEGFLSEGDVELRPAGEWIEGKLEGELVLGASLPMRLRPVLQALIEYPHGCVEQTSSRCRALLAVRALSPELWPEGGAPNVDGLLDAGIARLFTMQTRSGGFASWPGRRSTNPHGTLHAFEFLVEARASGLTVFESNWQRLLGYAESLLRPEQPHSVRALASSLLMRAGQPRLAHLRAYAMDAEDPLTRAVLAHGLATGGDTESARRLLERSSEGDLPRELGGALASPTKDRCLRLRAWFRIEPGGRRCAELLQTLLSECARPERLTTQELGQLSVALSEVLRTRAGEGLKPKGILHLGDRRIPFDGPTRLSFEWPEDRRIRIESKHPVHGMVTTRGYRPSLQASESLGLRVERIVRDARTGALARRFTRGGVYEVELRGHCDHPLPNLLVLDMLPAGFEIENDRLHGLTEPPGNERITANRGVDQLEYRDDRVLFFSTEPMHGAFVRRYRMRAVFAGTYAQPGALAEALYLPGARWAEGAGDPIRIEERDE